MDLRHFLFHLFCGVKTRAGETSTWSQLDVKILNVSRVFTLPALACATGTFGIQSFSKHVRAPNVNRLWSCRIAASCMMPRRSTLDGLSHHPRMSRRAFRVGKQGTAKTASPVHKSRDFRFETKSVTDLMPRNFPERTHKLPSMSVSKITSARIVCLAWLIPFLFQPLTASPIDSPPPGIGPTPGIKVSPRNFFKDCEEAINSYPIDTAQIDPPFTFSTSSMLSRYRLPKSAEHDDCKTTIDLDDSMRRDYSSWREIKDKFHEMNSWCYLHLCYDHKDIVGRDGGITLRLGPSDDASNGNGTSNAVVAPPKATVAPSIGSS